MLGNVGFRTFARMVVVLAALAAWLFATTPAGAQQSGPPSQSRGQAAAKPPTIEEKTAGMQKLDGYFPLYWDEPTGTLYLEILKF